MKMMACLFDSGKKECWTNQLIFKPQFVWIRFLEVMQNNRRMNCFTLQNDQRVFCIDLKTSEVEAYTLENTVKNVALLYCFL